MIKYLFVFCSLFFLLNIYPQGRSISAIFPEAHFKSKTNIYEGRGRVYVPGYLFKIKFSLKLSGNFNWNKPVALVYYLPSGKKILVVLNNECRVLYSNHLYDYEFFYTTRSNCVVDFQIGEYDSMNKDIMHYSDVRFVGSSVYLDISKIK
jgi:hypothetical protein